MYRLQIPLTEKNQQQLADLCLANGFVKRGKAFFRIHGNGIFQTVKFEYEHGFWRHELRFGIESMYSDLLPQHFTASGCIPHHYVLKPIGKKDAVGLMRVQSPEGKELSIITIDSPAQQIAFLKDFGMAWLNSITTQEILIDRLCALEPPRWNTPERIAPFLACGNYEDVERVISAILHQHGCAWGGFSWNETPWNQKLWTDEMYKAYRAMFPDKDEDLEFLQIHDWIYHEDKKVIKDYLQANYDRNCGYAKWRKRKK